MSAKPLPSLLFLGLSWRSVKRSFRGLAPGSGLSNSGVDRALIGILLAILVFVPFLAMHPFGDAVSAESPVTPMVAAGYLYTVGLRSDGTVVAVGDNSGGQCNVSSWSGIKQVAASYYHTVGLKSDGTVVAAGSNNSGQCNVSSWSGIRQVAGGYLNTVGVKSDGTVVVVGDNTDGQCNVSSWSDIKQVASGYGFTVGLKSDGTVVTVGNNSYGQCNVSSWSGIQQVAAGYYNTVGLKSDGTVVAVGNNYGQSNVASWSGIQQVAAGLWHTVGLKSDGTVVAVGYDSDGQCDVGSWTGIQQVAAGFEHTVGVKSDGSAVSVGNFGECNVSSWSGIKQVAAGYYHTVGLKSDGTVVTVGNNDYGELGISSWTGIQQVAAGSCQTVGVKSDGTVLAVGTNTYGERDVSSWSGIQQVAAGSYHTVGLKLDGTVVAVGRNDYGQCNVGSWSGIQQVDAEFGVTVGLKSDGTVVAVGDNSFGQCNVGSWSGIQQVAAGRGRTVGLKSDGTVVAVGDNYYGQCNVSSWSGIQQVAAASFQTVGLKSDGTVVAVGDNRYGECNVGSWTGIQQVDAGYVHTVGLRSDGTVVAAGAEVEVAKWNLGTAVNDETPPAAVNNLAATVATSTSLTLTWTSPGDDGNTGTASTYDIRYSTATVSDANWASASQCSGESAPKVAGSAETFTVTSLAPDTLYYFAMKTGDEAPNWSGLSNVVAKKTPAAADTTPPTTPIVIDDGTSTTSTTQLRATWTSSDPESGIAEYQYAIGTTAGGTDVISWTSADTSTAVTKSGLTLVVGAKYYFAVKAKNGEGLWSGIGVSDGILVESNEPPKDTSLRITQPLVVAPRFAAYTPGDRITAQFVVTNNSASPIVLSVLTVGGRGPGGDVVDFDWQEDVTISPGSSHNYIGNLTLPARLGIYHFFCTYQSKDGKWNPSVELGTGLSDEDRIEDIRVVEAVMRNLSDYLYEEAHLDRWSCNSWGAGLRKALTQEKLTLDPRDPKIDLLNQAIVLAYRMETSTATPYDLIQGEGLSGASEWWATIAGQVVSKFMGGVPGVTDACMLYGFDIAEALYLRDMYEVRMRESPIGDLWIVKSPALEGRIATFYNSTGGLFLTQDASLTSYSVHYRIGGDSTAQIESPGELRVLDGLDQVTGLVDGNVVEQIPCSTYSAVDKKATILFSSSDYRYQVVGVEAGTYGLEVSSQEGDDTVTFNAVDIPIIAGSRHEYTIDWEAVSQGSKGMTLKVDSDGDGKFEDSLTAGNKLSKDDFLSATENAGLASWACSAIGAGAALVVLAVARLVTRRRPRTQDHAQ